MKTFQEAAEEVFFAGKNICTEDAYAKQFAFESDIMACDRLRDGIPQAATQLLIKTLQCGGDVEDAMFSMMVTAINWGVAIGVAMERQETPCLK